MHGERRCEAKIIPLDHRPLLVWIAGVKFVNIEASTTDRPISSRNLPERDLRVLPQKLMKSIHF